MGMTVLWLPALALTGQAKPTQDRMWMHAGRPL